MLKKREIDVYALRNVRTCSYATEWKDPQFIFTVSPVRHWKDGGADNNWSKSVLVCAVRDLEQR